MPIRRQYNLLLLCGFALISVYFLWPGVWRKEGFEGVLGSNLLQTAASLFAAGILIYAYYSTNKEAKFLKCYALGMLVNTVAQAVWMCGIYSRQA